MAIGHGTAKLPYGKLKPALRAKPCEKLIKVELLDPKGKTLSKVERKLKSSALQLKPYEYHKASSDPGTGLRLRALLKYVKPSLDSVWNLLDESLKARRLGLADTARLQLFKIKHCLKEKRVWAVSDHLVYRFTHWAIGQIHCAIRTLDAIGLSPIDIQLSSNAGRKGKSRRNLSALLPRRGKVDNTSVGYKVIDSVFPTLLEGWRPITPHTFGMGVGVVLKSADPRV